MATTAVTTVTSPTGHSAFSGARALFGVAIAGGLPLGLFGLANLAGESVGILPLFFSPYGIPGWLGAGIHLSLMFLIGAAAGLAVQNGGRGVIGWVAALTICMIVFPFLAPWLDSLQLALYVVALLLLCAATTYRISRNSVLGGLLMVPSLLWLGVGAALGLTIAAAWTPPFALMQVNQQTPPAAL
jgi:tryptophan-rich sensory protein